MKFAIVNFTEKEEVAVVPINWLREDRCLWPPKKLSSQVLPHIEKEITASEAWDSFPVTIMRLYSTYSEARSKLPIAENESELNTTDPDDCGRGKRKKIKSKRKRPSSSSSTDSELNLDLNLIEAPKISKETNSYLINSQNAFVGGLQLQEPPTLLKSVSTYPVFNQAACTDDFTLTTEDDNDGHVNLVPLICDDSFTLSSGKSCEIIPPSESVFKSNNEPVLSDSYVLGTKEVNVKKNKKKEKFNKSRTTGLHHCNSSVTPSLKNNSTNISSSCKEKSASDSSGSKTNGFEVTVLKEISLLKFKINTISEKLDCMINYMHAKEIAQKTDHDLAIELKDVIPIKSFEELEKVEQMLKDENISNQMIQFLSRLGGHSCEQATKLMLKRVMVEDIAVSFSYLGIREKRAFKPLEINKVILCAVRKHVSWNQSSESQIEKTISNWLRHAKERLTYKKKL